MVQHGSINAPPDCLSSPRRHACSLLSDVVARSAISREQAAATAEEVWQFTGMDAADPSSWYGDRWRDGEYKESKIMVEMVRPLATRKICPTALALERSPP